jgi:hypothetical protein
MVDLQVIGLACRQAGQAGTSSLAIIRKPIIKQPVGLERVIPNISLQMQFRKI